MAKTGKLDFWEEEGLRAVYLHDFSAWEKAVEDYERKPYAVAWYINGALWEKLDELRKKKWH